MSTIILTDAPDVVELKREFRQLDEREEELKVALDVVRERKAEIALQIFHTKEAA